MKLDLRSALTTGFSGMRCRSSACRPSARRPLADDLAERPAHDTPGLWHSLSRAGLVVLWISVVVLTGQVQAGGLLGALAQAYESNPALLAAQAELQASRELISQAEGQRLPSINFTARVGECREFHTSLACRNEGGSVGVELTQALYRGGRITAGISRATLEVMARQALLLDREQTILLAVATAFLDVVSEQAAVELNLQNEELFQQRKQAAQERFQVGGSTNTEVSQAAQRLAGASAGRIQAEGRLAIARAAYVRFVGVPPGRLEFQEIELPMPASLEAGVARATIYHPLVQAAQLRQQAASQGLEIAKGALRPSADLSLSYSENLTRWSNWDSRSGEAQVGLRVTVPLYGAGITSSQVRGARQLLVQRQQEADEFRRQAEQTMIQAWYSLLTARAGLNARQVEIQAAELALEGIEREFEFGSRTLLEVLDSQQELLDARIGLLQSRRERVLALFSLQLAVGSLTARHLGLQTESAG